MGQSVKVSTKAVIAINDFHRAVYTVGIDAHRATVRTSERFTALLTEKYGAPVIGKDADGAETRSGGPSFEQYRADQSALAELAKQRKLADNQWVRKPYAAAVKRLYGALPVSMAPEAVLKRAQREAAEKLTNAAIGAAQAGAPLGETQERQPSAEESIESVVARLGVLETLDACIRILASDESTKGQATHLQKMAAKVRSSMKPATPATQEPAKV